MNNEEKQAIKNCNLLLNGDITLHIIDDDGGTAYAGTVNKLYNKDLETVLNLIEKQQKVIDEMAECIYKTIDMFQMLDIAKSINYDLEKVFNGLEDEEVLNIIKEYFKKKVEGN